MRKRWAESFKPPYELWRIEYDVQTDTAIYLSKAHITTGVNEDIHGRNPLWHVWRGDDWVYCGQSINESYAAYDRCRHKEPEVMSCPNV